MTLRIFGIALFVAVLGFLYLVWVLNGLALVMYFLSFALTAAFFGLPWYVLGKRRERRMIREMEAAAKGVSPRPRSR